MEVAVVLPHFNPDTVMNSGQVFRWTKTSAENPLYKIVTGDFAFTLQRIAGRDDLYSIAVNDYEDIQVALEYLDSYTDYSRYDLVIQSSEDAYTKAALAAIPGMRIMRQDLWETMISFIISQNNNIPNIIRSVSKLASTFGTIVLSRPTTRICTTYWSFPTPERLASVSEDELRLKTSIGYRAEYVVNLSRQVVDGSFSLDALKTMDWVEADHYLRAVRGIGAKVANCIQLYGLHHLDAYPVDRWVERIIQDHYAHLSKHEYLGFVDKEYQGMQGYVQQLQFYYKRSK